MAVGSQQFEENGTLSVLLTDADAERPALVAGGLEAASHEVVALAP